MKNNIQAILKLFVICLLIVPSSFTSTVSAAEVVDVSEFANAMPGQLLVKFKDIDSPQLIQFSSNEVAAAALMDIKTYHDVELVQPNYLYEAAAIPNDTLLEQQNYLDQINAFGGWDVQTSAKDVIVAVIDTGFDINHPDIKDNLWVNPYETMNGRDDDRNGFDDDVNGWDFVNRDGNLNYPVPTGISPDAIGTQHATSVAGLIGAVGNNSTGIAGVAWNVKLMDLRVLNIGGRGDSYAVTEAIQYALLNGADIINMSLVGADYDPLAELLLTEAYNNNIVVISAAGNKATNLNSQETYPVCYNHHGKATVIGVGAVNPDFSRASFSNFGSNCVDIVAPGIKMFSTRLVRENFESQEYYKALFSGTSFSAPLVTGVVALMKQMSPNLTPDDVLQLLQDGAILLDNPDPLGFTYALDAGKTLRLLANSPELMNLPPAPGIDKSLFIDADSDIYGTSLPEFIAYKKSIGSAVLNHYQMPGPILVTPLVFDDAALNDGLRLKRRGAEYYVSSWVKESRSLWKYDTRDSSLEVFLTIPVDDPQTIGNVAFGNIDFDDEKELIIASGPGGQDLISIYTVEGKLKYRFQPFDAAITAGLDVDVVDMNEDGIMEIVVVPEADALSEIRLFDYTGAVLNKIVTHGNFRGGATIDVTDVDGDGYEEILVGPGAKGGPHVRIYRPIDGKLLKEFFAGDVTDSGGADIQYFDVDSNGTTEFIVSYKDGHLPVVRLYDQEGVFIQEFSTFDDKYLGGIGVIPY